MDGLYPIELIQLERINLRMIETKDAAGIFEIRNNREMLRYTGVPQMTRMAEAEEFVRSRIQGMKDDKWIYLIIADPQKDALMGTVCIFNFDASGNSADIGYELLPAYRGRGFVHDAVNELVNLASNMLGLTTLTADIHEDNYASINVVKRAGFQHTKKLSDGYHLYSLHLK